MPGGGTPGGGWQHGRMLTTVLFDYGCVISLPQSPEDGAALARQASDVPEAEFWARYWDLRLDYDRGLPDQDYWSFVLGREASDDETAELTRLDIESWSRTDSRVLGTIEDLRASGVGLGLLSNAPASMARAVEKAGWATGFTALTFSADLQVVKPEAGAYLSAAQALGVPPDQVLFVDDRAVNAVGAREVGMSAVHYTAHDDLVDAVAALRR